jgi:hypothetical protein
MSISYRRNRQLSEGNAMSWKEIDREKEALAQADRLLARADRDWKSAVDQVQWSLQETSMRIGDYSKTASSYSASMIAASLVDGASNAGIARLLMAGSHRDGLVTAKAALVRDIAEFGADRVLRSR